MIPGGKQDGPEKPAGTRAVVVRDSKVAPAARPSLQTVREEPAEATASVPQDLEPAVASPRVAPEVTPRRRLFAVVVALIAATLVFFLLRRR